MDDYVPVPVPLGDGRHDIGDDVRATIVERLTSDWSRDPDLTPEKARQLAMWAAASVRALLHELGTLRDLASGPADTRQILDDHIRALEFLRELTKPPCEWGCLSHPEERPCLRCRAAKWLHSEDEPDPIASVPPGDEVFAPPFRQTCDCDPKTES